MNTHGRIAAVLVVKMQYPSATWAKVSLLAAGAAAQHEPRWIHRDELFYDQRLLDDQQPTGQVTLYLSDLLSNRLPIPSAFCRPTAAEQAAGISR